MQRGLSILGSTGSIGCQTLEVVEELEDSFQVLALTAHSNYQLLAEQVRRFRPSLAVIVNEKYEDKLQYQLKDYSTTLLSGTEGLLEAATIQGAELVVNGLVGACGLAPTMAAIEVGIDLALANKETLVIGGELVMPLAERKGVRILPIDSEHSAIFQLLEGEKIDDVKRIILTASGGPFRGCCREELEGVTPASALKHPNWEMGGKITIDSATLMNKGLEVIEAHWLFGLEYDKIDVVVHPESIIHSLVEFKDATMVAELGLPDMRAPIQHALTYPRRRENSLEPLNLAQVGALTFEEPDLDLFAALRLATQAGREGGTKPVVLNAANEVAVEAFLDERLAFLQLPELVEVLLDEHQSFSPGSLQEVLDVDGWTRRRANEIIGGLSS